MSVWFRFYTDSRHKSKIQSMPGELFKHWVNLMTLVKEFDSENGTLPDWSEIAFQIRVSEAEAIKICDDLRNRKLIDVEGNTLSMHDWKDHQYESDNSTKRVQKHRMQKMKQMVKQNGNVSVTVQSRADKSRTEKKRADGSKPAARVPPNVDEIISELQAEPAYAALNVKHECDKYRAWCSANGKQPNKRGLVNWLNRADQPMLLSTATETKVHASRIVNY